MKKKNADSSLTSRSNTNSLHYLSVKRNPDALYGSGNSAQHSLHPKANLTSLPRNSPSDRGASKVSQELLHKLQKTLALNCKYVQARLRGNNSLTSL